MISSSHSQHFSKIKHCIFNPYPTTIRRTVCTSHAISFDHSVMPCELKNLHRDMAKQVTEYFDDPKIRVELVHLDPRTTKHVRGRY
jgi:hypothetical protein